MKNIHFYLVCVAIGLLIVFDWGMYSSIKVTQSNFEQTIAELQLDIEELKTISTQQLQSMKCTDGYNICLEQLQEIGKDGLVKRVWMEAWCCQ